MRIPAKTLSHAQMIRTNGKDGGGAFGLITKPEAPAFDWLHVAPPPFLLIRIAHSKRVRRKNAT